MAEGLAEADYEPIILTTKPLAYPKLFSTSSQLSEPFEIHRTFSLDAARHMALFGRYPEFLAQPDRWVSWWLSAVPHGLSLIRRRKPKVIWSTYPIATSHLIASTLHRLTGIPWIADFRDPMVLPAYPTPGATLATRQRLEQSTVTRAHTCVFVTQRSLDMCAERYMGVEHAHFELIPNGYDEQAFSSLFNDKQIPSELNEGIQKPLTLVHSGLLYSCGRNPQAFLEAIANLLKQGKLTRDALHIILRASGSEGHYESMVARYELHDIVEIAPMLERQDALVEQHRADGVLLFQGAEFNAQVPAKLYEYFRNGKPILALVDGAGETADIVLRENAGLVVDMNNVLAIETGLLEFIDKLKRRVITPVDGDALQKYSRRVGAQKLVSIIDKLVGSR
ncbi:glycosyltransferase [Acidihalobacter aeolianus]|nr:glycosyltransferase [Acidihalobacter aeolianus]